MHLSTFHSFLFFLLQVSFNQTQTFIIQHYLSLSTRLLTFTLQWMHQGQLRVQLLPKDATASEPLTLQFVDDPSYHPSHSCPTKYSEAV